MDVRLANRRQSYIGLSEWILGNFFQRLSVEWKLRLEAVFTLQFHAEFDDNGMFVNTKLLDNPGSEAAWDVYVGRGQRVLEKVMKTIQFKRYFNVRHPWHDTISAGASVALLQSDSIGRG